MAFITVDSEKCKRDGICVAECPSKIIKMLNDVPFPSTAAKNVCIRCGHCVSVCPHEALSIEFLSSDECLPVNKELNLSESHAEHFLRSRRSIRAYKNKEIDRDTLEKAIKMASYAPSASNRQSVRWLVVSGKENVQKVGLMVIDWMKYCLGNDPKLAEILFMELLVRDWEKGIDRITRNAPNLIFTYADKIFGNWDADCHTSLAYLELAMPSFGLGSCWGGYLKYAINRWPKMLKELGFPEDHICHGAVMVGYPKFRYHRMPPRNTPEIIFK